MGSSLYAELGPNERFAQTIPSDSRSLSCKILPDKRETGAFYFLIESIWKRQSFG